MGERPARRHSARGHGAWLQFRTGLSNPLQEKEIGAEILASA